MNNEVMEKLQAIADGSGDGIKVTGRVQMWLNGELVVDKNNIVTTAGKNRLATNILNASAAGNTFVGYMGFGTGTNPVAAGDTILQTELSGNGYSRKSVTPSNPQSNQISYYAQLTGITSPVTVQEAGLFDVASTTAGAFTLCAHLLTGAVALNSSSDSLAVTWTISFT